MSILAYVVRRDAEVVTAHLELPFQNCFPNPVISAHSIHSATIWLSTSSGRSGSIASSNLSNIRLETKSGRTLP